ncbi:transposase [Catalinimonas alkaloidigena]|uniref:Transposase n=1 Tax=Catalinimonas alkaloidigena TaxID=1075417 RepID=A0A1G9VYY3_9BACT|nr:transposase [Catalinimonas alkaloidigena]
MATRKTYTGEFKQQAVLLAEQHGASQVSRDLGIERSLIDKWRRRLSEKGTQAFPGKGKAENEELAQLKRENMRLKEENEVLKKAVGIFTNRPR